MQQPAIVTLEISVPEDTGGAATRNGEPITIGLPLPRGRAEAGTAFSLRTESGEAVPLQTQVLEEWPDGSVRWVLLDFQTPSVVGRTRYDLAVSGSAPPALDRGIEVLAEGTSVVVDTGRAVFRVEPGGSFPLDVLRTAAADRADWNTQLVIDPDGLGTSAVRIHRVALKESGVLRSSIEFGGDVRCDGKAVLQISGQLHFFSGSAVVRVLLTLRNSNRARHPKGYWDLGESSSVRIRNAAIVIPLPSSLRTPSPRCSPERGQPLGAVALPFALYQDSSGGEQWQSTNHWNASQRVTTTFKGYEVSAGGEVRGGRRATPVVNVESGGDAVGVAVPYFWQNFPKSLEVDAGRLTLGLFPPRSAEPQELQAGEQKTHMFFLAFGPDEVSDPPLDWCRSPLFVHADASWYCASGALSYLSPASDSSIDEYDRLVNAAIQGPDAFTAKREIIDEYGWRHFGDIYADHETAFHRGPTALVSHYNNQYDAMAGFAAQFFRCPDRRWWLQFEELAAHVKDIDTYHTSEDKAAYNGGLFWHTNHYLDARTATHRTYSRLHQTGGGGPSSEHNYTTGLLLHYFLTGDTTSRDAVIGLADWVVNMDDGCTTIFKWLHRGPTGYATASGSFVYHGPGRGAGNSVNALLDGHRVAPDRGFLNKAESLIRRVIHPSDDIGTRKLLDIERKWFYTIFLQALGKYLDQKVLSRELDEMYAYARASLLHYARWMAVHEYPYLETPELLEFPTESWAAQELRKSEIFDVAAMYAEGAERARFRDRARFFFDYATRRLAAFPTRTRARPVVILLSNGFKRQYFAEHDTQTGPAPIAAAEAYGAPVAFVPQRLAATIRLRRLLMAGSVMVLLCVVAIVLWLLR